MPIKLNPNLPFSEAAAYFKDKVNLPTATWTDLWQGQHARAFVVAGAMKDDLLTDFSQAIGKAINDGSGYKEFKDQFDGIVQKHGWAYNGGAAWRSRVIYNTNIRTSYMAGRFKQMEAVTQQRPYWLYRHSKLVADPRPEHQAWDGLVLRHDDPFWKTHYPPNGWGCKCRVHAINERDLKKLGKSKADIAPALNWQDKLVGARGPNPFTVKVPEGIDAGWAYNVGEAAQGKRLPKAVFDEWDKTKNRGWLTQENTDWKSYGRPSRLNAAVSLLLGKRMKDVTEMERYLKQEFNGNEKVFNVQGLPIRLNAAFLADHLQKDLSRSAYLPWLLESIKNPDEIWLSFEQHQGTGLYRLRTRFIKMVNKRDSDKGMTVVLDANKGDMVGLTFIPKGKTRGINSGRKGKLLYARD